MGWSVWNIDLWGLVGVGSSESKARIWLGGGARDILESLPKGGLCGDFQGLGQKHIEQDPERLETEAPLCPSGIPLGAAATGWAAPSRRHRRLHASSAGSGWSPAPVPDSVVPSCLTVNPGAYQPGPCPAQLRNPFQDPTLHHR